MSVGPDELASLVRAALRRADLPDTGVAFERPRQRTHGDWATNVALTLAKPAGLPPRQIAERLVAELGTPEGIEHVEVAGPGFVNFHLAQASLAEVVRSAVAQRQTWGRSDTAAGRSVDVEFVSANPTGPLHVGHGRQTVLGDALANVLSAVGWSVTREYYFNDAGEQMRRFGASVQALMRGQEPSADGYHGAYVGEIAAALAADGVDVDDAEAVTEGAYAIMLEQIKATLERCGVRFDVYFGERSLHGSDGIPAALERMRGAGFVYDADGATWVRTTAFGDEKDRVAIKADGQPTYFAADCAYLADKFDRGFDHLLYVWGSDHHGYIARLEAAAAAQGYDAERVEVVMHQFVNFLRSGEPVRMSKRSGAMTTVDDLLDEVGADAARYTLLRYSGDVEINFDLDEVVKQDKDNPVYYVQYSSARIAGIMRTVTERGVDPGGVDDARLELLTHDAEAELMRRIGMYPETVAVAAAERAPHRLARYAEDLAEGFHKFYTECTVVSDDPALTGARYWLVEATRQTLVNALGLLGVTAPDRM